MEQKYARPDRRSGNHQGGPSRPLSRTPENVLLDTILAEEQNKTPNRPVCESVSSTGQPCTEQRIRESPAAVH